MVYHIYKVFLALMYMQHKHMVYGKLHIYLYLVLDKNANDNVYSTPLRHEVWNVEHKIIILGIGFVTIHFHILVCNISIILNMIMFVCSFSFHELFFVFSLINDPIFAVIFCQKLLKFLT